MGVVNCCKCNAEIPEGSKFCMNCGANQSIPDMDSLVALVEDKLSKSTGFGFNAKGRVDCKRWITDFGFDEVCGAVETAIGYYLKFDNEQNPIESSVDEVFAKISGICANRKKAKDKPYIADAQKMFNYANKAYRLSGWLFNGYKTHIERILYLLHTKDKNNYIKASEDFFWQIKNLDEKYDFYHEMDGIIAELEE